ncbi:MAG: uracil-DNA glycosylase family protein [Croceibacterium sp.]
MDSRPPLPLAEQIAAAQGWWREAGVDFVFRDKPQGWLAEPSAPTIAPATRPTKAPAPAAVAPPPPPAIGGDPASWPATLPDFHRWWLETPGLDPSGTHARVAPRGSQGAELAVMVPMPEPGDSDILLAGPQGRLVAAMIRSMGLEPEQAYLAAALPCHTALPDWSRLAADGMGAILRHHLSLAAPKRLLVLGKDVLSLLQHDPAQATPPGNEITIQGGKLSLLASYSPARLLENPRQQAGLWQRWLEWTDGKTP